MKRFTQIALGGMMIAGFCAAPGCDKTVSETKKTETNSDGTTTTEKQKIVEKSDGTLKKEESKDRN